MRVLLELDGEEFEVFLAREGEKLKVTIGDETFDAKIGEQGNVTLAGQTVNVRVLEKSVVIDHHEVPFRIADFQAGAGAGGAGGGARGARVKPPMPGKIVSIAVQEGAEVKAGQLLLVLEAMKMQNEIVSPVTATVKKIHVKPGQNVEAKDVIVELG